MIKDEPKLQVRIIAPKQIIFQGPALSVSSINSMGRFDILPFHANFISFIEKHPISIRNTDNKVLNFNFDFAIIYYAQNVVSIYTQIPQSQLKITR